MPLEVVGSTDMGGAWDLAVSRDGNFVYVAALFLDGLAVVDVGTDQTNPTVVGSITNDATNMNGRSKTTFKKR